MKLLHICFCVLIGTALSGCEIPMTAQDRIAVTRICEVLELKAQVAAAVWPGFDDPQFEVPLVYFTDSLCYAVNPEARFLAQYPATLRYRVENLYDAHDRLARIPHAGNDFLRPGRCRFGIRLPFGIPAVQFARDYGPLHTRHGRGSHMADDGAA